MFKNHFCNFGGRNFHQVEGGLIGLRGTCAIARVILQIFYGKWKRVVEDLMIKILRNSRFMDDG